MAGVQAKRITHLLIDMFTNPNAGFSQIQDLPEFQSLGVIAITKDCPVQAIKGRLIEWLNHVIEKCPTLLVLCWVSPPCTGGSPVLNLIAKARRLELQKEHFRTFSFLLSEATPIIEIANIRCLELSKSCTYWKTELIQTNCQLWGLRFMKEYPRCSYQSDQSMTAKHVFRVACNNAPVRTQNVFLCPAFAIESPAPRIVGFVSECIGCGGRILVRVQNEGITGSCVEISRA